MSQYQNTVAFQAPNDFATEQAGVERQRRMAELLMAKGQQPGPQGQMIGNSFVAPSWTQQLSQALNAPLGAYRSKQADEKSKDIATRQRQAYADELGQFSKLANGEAERTIAPLTPNDDEGNAMPSAVKEAIPGDKKAALAYALGAQNPALQKYGMEQMMPKAPEWTLAERFNEKTGQPEKFMYDKNNPASMQPIGGQQAAKGVAVNGQLVNPATGEKIGAEVPKQADAFSPYKDLVGPGGVPNQPLIDARKAIQKSGASNVNLSVAGPKAFETELGKLDAEQLGKWRDNAQTANSTLSTVQALRDAEKQGAYSGGGANAKLAAANIINGFTGATPKGLVGSQLYNAEASKLVLDKVKTLGANPSNADREFIEKTVPQLATSAEARQQMANYLEKQAVKTIDLYKRADTHARANSGLKGFEVVPNEASKAPTSVLDQADAILRGK